MRRASKQIDKLLDLRAIRSYWKEKRSDYYREKYIFWWKHTVKKGKHTADPKYNKRWFVLVSENYAPAMNAFRKFAKKYPLRLLRDLKKAFDGKSTKAFDSCLRTLSSVLHG